jgi:hypothetical protein
VSYDAPYPQPLHAARPITGSMSVALLLAPHATPASLARLDVHIHPGARIATRMQDPALEALRMGNPAGRALPLLGALAARSASALVLEYLRGGTMTVAVSLC